MEENSKKQQVTIGFLFLVSGTVLLCTRAVYEMVQVVLQGINTTHFLVTMAEVM